MCGVICIASAFCPPFPGVRFPLLHYSPQHYLHTGHHACWSPFLSPFAQVTTHGGLLIPPPCSRTFLSSTLPPLLLPFTQAITGGDPLIPANSLSRPHPTILLPKYPPPFFMAQPFVEVDPVLALPPRSAAEAAGAAWATTALEGLVGPLTLAEGEAAGVRWAGGRRWVEVNIGLLGSVGDMKALGPSLVARLQPEEDVPGGEGSTPGSTPGGTCDVELEEGVLPSSAVVHLSPVPPSVAPEAALEAARQRAVAVADRLGLAGLVRISAFMHVDSGELVVMNVKTLPDLAADSPLYLQVGGGERRGLGMRWPSRCLVQRKDRASALGSKLL